MSAASLLSPALPNEPVATPNECKDTEPKIDWLPLTTFLHPDWQKQIENLLPRIGPDADPQPEEGAIRDSEAD